MKKPNSIIISLILITSLACSVLPKSVVPKSKSSVQSSSFDSAFSTCSYDVAINPQQLPLAGGTISVTVTTGAGCNWNVTQSVGPKITPWLIPSTCDISNPCSGTKTVSVNVLSTTQFRQAILSIGYGIISPIGVDTVITQP